MTTVDILQRAGVDERTEQAQEAVRAFRAMQPTLSAYARALTGRKEVRVELAARDNGSTDGKRIFFRPPAALGDRTPHDRQLCDTRNEAGIMRCPACMVREEVLVTIYHEIAHICFDSFAAVTDADKRRAIIWAMKEVPAEYRDKVQDRIDQAPRWKTDTYPKLVSLINEYLPYLQNCLEDARVNRALFKARPGTKRMFHADHAKVFEKGYEVKDENGNYIVKSWKDAPLNSQVMIGTFCKALGYDYSNWFHPQVVEALDDEELTRIIDEMELVRTAGQVYNLSFKVLARLRELGYCGTPQDPDPEPEPEPEPEEESDGDEGNPKEGDSDSPDQERDQQPEESGGDPSGGSDQAGREESEGESDDSTDPSAEAEPDSGGTEGEPGASGDADGDADHGEEPIDDDAQMGDQKGDPASDRGAGGDAELDEAGRGDDPSEAGASEGAESSEADETAGEAGRSDGHNPADPDVAPGDPGEEVGDDGDAGGSGESSDPDEADGDPGTSEQGDGDQSNDLEESEHGDSDPEGDDSDQSSSGAGHGGPEDTGEQDSASDGSPDRSDELVPGGGDAGPQSERGDSGPELDADGTSEPSGADQDSPEEGEQGADPEPSGRDDQDFSSVEDGDPFDTGADDGYGGTELVGEDNEPLPEMGTPDDLPSIVKEWTLHAEKPKSIEATEMEKAVETAMIQGLYFTTPSKNVVGVNEHEYDAHDGARGWQKSNVPVRIGQESDLDVPEAVIQPALLTMRRAFSDNQRGSADRNRRTGKVNNRVLGRRAWSGDDRLFYKKYLPGKKDYEAIIMVDLSGSQAGVNIALEKRAVYGQAELLSRMGVPFSIVAHTGARDEGGLSLEIYWIKRVEEPWNSKTQMRLRDLRACSVNLDGHALEFGRKIADRSRATDRIILYYSDGKMPQANHDEELEILKREIAICRQKNYTLLGVGIRTDSPARHGLDTVRVDGDDDLKKVVEHLGRRLSTTINR